LHASLDTHHALIANAANGACHAADGTCHAGDGHVTQHRGHPPCRTPTQHHDRGTPPCRTHDRTTTRVAFDRHAPSLGAAGQL